MISIIQWEFSTSYLFAHIQIDMHDIEEICLWVISSLNELQLICLHTSIAVISTRLNGFSYCYVTFNSIQH